MTKKAFKKYEKFKVSQNTLYIKGDVHLKNHFKETFAKRSKNFFIFFNIFSFCLKNEEQTLASK